MQTVVDLVLNHLNLPIYLTFLCSSISVLGPQEVRVSTVVLNILMDCAPFPSPGYHTIHHLHIPKITPEQSWVHIQNRSLLLLPPFQGEFLPCNSHVKHSWTLPSAGQGASCLVPVTRHIWCQDSSKSPKSSHLRDLGQATSFLWTSDLTPAKAGQWLQSPLWKPFRSASEKYFGTVIFNLLLLSLLLL